MPQIVWTARPDGYLDYYNERWYEFTGFSRGSTFGDKSWQPILHPDEVERFRETWYGASSPGSPSSSNTASGTARNSAGDGSWGAPFQSAMRGNIVKWFGSCTDIDDQKRVEDDLRRANQDLEQFAFSASHDLQEPLRSIKIYSELLTHRSGIGSMAKPRNS